MITIVKPATKLTSRARIKYNIVIPHSVTFQEMSGQSQAIGDEGKPLSLLLFDITHSCEIYPLVGDLHSAQPFI